MYQEPLKSVKKLHLTGIKHRFFLIFLFLFLIDNPTTVSVVEFLRTGDAPFTLQITVVVVTCTVLIVLLRHTWTAMRLLGHAAVVLLILALASLLWYLQEWIILSETTRYFAKLLVITVVLTFGQVLPFYVRQLSGISPVLKYPP
ncbi:MAG TPA: hypothetical protein DCS21_04925 [Gammaproteobacteria bacterium]|nr:hypothetical protein [Gammaproteobacteria bacterium]